MSTLIFWVLLAALLVVIFGFTWLGGTVAVSVLALAWIVFCAMFDERKRMELTREEQETIIRGNPASKTWEVVTADPVMMRYMESRGYEPDARKNPWGYKSYTFTGADHSQEEQT